MKDQVNDIKLNFATLRYEEPIVHITFVGGTEIGFPETRMLTAAAEKLSNNKPYLVFADARAGVEVTREGRKLAGNASEAPLHKGSAILVNNKMLTLAINFFSGLATPEYPYRAFTDKDEAIKWLLKITL